MSRIHPRDLHGIRAVASLKLAGAKDTTIETPDLHGIRAVASLKQD